MPRLKIPHLPSEERHFMMLVFASAALLSMLIGIASVYLFVFAGRDELPRPLTTMFSAPAPISAISPALPTSPVMPSTQPDSPAAPVLASEVAQVPAVTVQTLGISPLTPAAVLGVSQEPDTENESELPEESYPPGRDKGDEDEEEDRWTAAALSAYVFAKSIKEEPEKHEDAREQKKVTTEAVPPPRATEPVRTVPHAAKPVNMAGGYVSNPGDFKKSDNKGSKGYTGHNSRSGKRESGRGSRR